MDSFIYSINATVPIFLVMIIGWFIKQIGLIDDHFANVANRYVFKVALPALLFRDLSKSDFKGKFDPQFVLYCSIVTILMFSLVWIATEILMKDDTQKGAFVQGSCRSSAAILGMAFVQNMYSDTGMAPLMIVAAVPLFNIFAVVVLTFKAHPADSSEAVKAGRGNNIKKAFVNILKNPIIIGIVVGLLLSIFRVDFPLMIDNTIGNIAKMATPLALLAIGGSFEFSNALKKMGPAVTGSAIKLVIMAAVFLPVAVWLGYRDAKLMALVIMLGSPTTPSCYIMAKNMKCDGTLTSSMVVITTMMSAFTITLIVFVLRTLGYL